MQEAAVLQMYFDVLPGIAKAVAEPLSKVGNSTMYGDGNTSKMIHAVTTSTNQISSRLLDGIGIDLKSMMNSFITDKAIGQGIAQKNITNVNETNVNEKENIDPVDAVDDTDFDVDVNVNFEDDNLLK